MRRRPPSWKPSRPGPRSRRQPVPCCRSGRFRPQAGSRQPSRNLSMRPPRWRQPHHRSSGRQAAIGQRRLSFKRRAERNGPNNRLPGREPLRSSASRCCPSGARRTHLRPARRFRHGNGQTAPCLGNRLPRQAAHRRRIRGPGTVSPSPQTGHCRSRVPSGPLRRRRRTAQRWPAGPSPSRARRGSRRTKRRRRWRPFNDKRRPTSSCPTGPCCRT